MDYKELIEGLRDLHKNYISEFCMNDVLNCDDLCECRNKDCIVLQAITAIETLLAEREAAGWISVGDKLPEPYKTVFAHRENGVIELMYLVRYGKWSVPESKYLPRVTHWMPLPTPPDRQQTDS